MNKASHDQSWDYFRTVNGIGLRAIAQLPADKLDAHPIPNMRTPKELIVHMYTIVVALPAAVAKGEIKDTDEEEAATAKRIRTKDELVAWTRAQWTEGARIANGLTEAQIAGMVKSPWGHDFEGYVMMQILYNEYWHHRGQLYCYLRALGVEPVSLYDFEHNEAGFERIRQASA